MVEITKVSSGGHYEAIHSYSRVVMVDSWIYMAISAGVNPETGNFADDAAEQAKQAISNIEHALATVSSDLSDIIRLVVSIPNREDIMAVQDYVGGRFKGIEPAMSLICTPLGSDEYKVEFEVTAYKGAGKQPQKRIRSGLFGA
jgi:enamine deaminase RidA (YjgF/YER057c/UK114 family)